MAKIKISENSKMVSIPMKEERQPWLLCQHCIDAIKSRGERLIVLGEYMDYDESVESGTVCEWCGDNATLYDCD